VFAASVILAATQVARPDMATQPPWTDVRIIALQPAEYALASARPGFSGQFGVPVDPTSLQFTLDGNNISNLAYASSFEFLLAVPSSISEGPHTIRVTGKATTGATFDRSWTFVSAGASTQNYLVLTPTHDFTNGSSFVITGTTLPYSHLRIAATPSLQPDGVLAATNGTFAVDAYADENGEFSVPVYLNQGGNVTVRVVSIDPTADAGASATLYVVD
jgi:hypothetical protein